MNLLSSSHVQVQEQAVWALGNIAGILLNEAKLSGMLIFLLMFYLCLTLALFDVFVYAGDGPFLRNFVIASGALKPLLALAHNSMNNVSEFSATVYCILFLIYSLTMPEASVTCPK